MRVHPIGIIRSRDLPSVADLQSVDAMALCWIRVGPLAVGILESENAVPTPVAHASAVEAVFRSVCILPARYESAPSDGEAMRRTADERSEEFLKRLDFLEGCCEFGLRIRRDEPENAACARRLENADISDPRRYLQARRAFYAARDATGHMTDPYVERLIERAEGVRDWRILPAPRGLFRPTFLVEKAASEMFRARMEAIQYEGGDLIEEIDGPWPPYSFV